MSDFLPCGLLQQKAYLGRNVIGREEGGGVVHFQRNFRFCTFLVSSKLIFEVNIFNGRTPAHMLFKEWHLLALGLVFVAF